MDLISSQPFNPAMEARARVPAIREQLAKGTLRAAVVGCGKSGVAAIDLLLDRGAEVTVLDDRADDVELPGIAVAPISKKAIDSSELIVLSPGVPRTRPEFHDAIARGTVVSEIELASWFIRAPMVGITGTNGKSTTTALVAHILECAGKRVFAGGNLGRPLAELAKSGESVDVAVVELSSYQLESIVEATFAVACWLNLTPDHVDRYPDVATYAAAKKRLLERRSVNGIAVLNAKDRWCSGAGIRLGGPIRWFAAADHSDLAGPMGTLAATEVAIRSVWDERETYRIANPALPGLHNRANACAAIECARHFDDVSAEAVQKGLDSFGGLPHRIERIAVIAGVAWYNDSKATKVDSAVIGVRAIGAPKILIAGGKDKGSPWKPLVDASRATGVKLVLAIGAAQPIVVESFKESGIEVREAGTLESAIAIASQLARQGDAVLLSPACASFDQFKNFEDRGDQFRALVKALAGERA